MSARILPFPEIRKETPMMALAKQALIVAAVIAVVFAADRMTGNKISTALAA